MSKSTETISARVSEDVLQKLKLISTETERPINFHINKALDYYLDEIIGLQIALDRINDPTIEVLSAEEAKEALDL